MDTSSKVQSLALKLLRSRKAPDFDMRRTLASLAPDTLAVLNFKFYHYAEPYFITHLLNTPDKQLIDQKLLTKALRERSVSGFQTPEERRNALRVAATRGHMDTSIVVLEAGNLDVLEELKLMLTDNPTSSRDAHLTLIRTGRIDAKAMFDWARGRPCYESLRELRKQCHVCI